MADGTFPESIGFIMFVDPVEEPKVFGERMRSLEGDRAINPSVSFNPTNHALRWVNALWLASLHLWTTGIRATIKTPSFSNVI